MTRFAPEAATPRKFEIYSVLELMRLPAGEEHYFKWGVNCSSSRAEQLATVTAANEDDWDDIVEVTSDQLDPKKRAAVLRGGR